MLHLVSKPTCRVFSVKPASFSCILGPQAGLVPLTPLPWLQVGHQVIAAYAECMGLPLYRRRITGRSADQVCGAVTEGWADQGPLCADLLCSTSI